MNRPFTRRFQQVKWTIYGLVILAITVIEAYHFIQEGSLTEHITSWLIALAVVVTLIEVSYRTVWNLQGQYERQLEETRRKSRQQEALVELSAKLTSTTDEAHICQSAIDELKNSLGFENISLYVEAENGEGRTRYGDSTHSGGEPEKGRLPKVNAPLRVGGKPYGYLIVENRRSSAFPPDEMAVIYAVANQTAVALENSRRFAQLRRQQSEADQRHNELHARERFVSLLNTITRDALRAQGFQEMLQTLTEHLGQLFEADSCILTIWDETLNQAVPTTASGPLRYRVHNLRLEPSEMVVATSVLSSGRALVIEKTDNSPFISARLQAKLGCQSLLALPLIASDQKLGAALISFQNEHKFSPAEINFGEQAASQIALSIAKARALDIAQRRAQELGALQRATATLLTTLQLETLLGQILDAAMSAIPEAERGSLHLIAPETGQLTLRAASGYNDPRIRSIAPTSSMSYTARAVRERRPQIIQDVKNDIIPNAEGDFPDSPDIASMIIVPLIMSERVLGAVALGSLHRYVFTETHQNLLVSFAAMATTAINNAQLHEEVERQAKTDTLTGLLNRRGFFELALREVSRSRRFKRPLTAIMFDIDDFKQINDQHGHRVGDQILSGVSSQCQAELRQIDLISRYGGDEFLILLPETDLPHAIPVAERLRKQAADMAFPAEDTLVKVTLSAGIAYLEDNDTLEALIERTDQALYKAKQAGKNRIEF